MTGERIRVRRVGGDREASVDLYPSSWLGKLHVLTVDLGQVSVEVDAGDEDKTKITYMATNETPCRFLGKEILTGKNTTRLPNTCLTFLKEFSFTDDNIRYRVYRRGTSVKKQGEWEEG
jgi:hypothetical protein